MTPSGFIRAFERTFGREGRLKYTSPAEAARLGDLGGETLGGIARGRRPDWPGWPLVDQLAAQGLLSSVLQDPHCQPYQQLLAMVREDYHANYWARLGLDRVPEPLSLVLFDAAINQGPGRAAKLLQRLLNALNRRGRDYADVAVDGDLGPATHAALRGFVERRGSEGLRVLVAGLMGLRAESYVALAETKPDQEDNLYGWLKNRVADDLDLLKGC